MVVLDFPLNPPKPVDRDLNLEPLLVEASGGLPRTRVLLCPNTKKLLIRLEVKRGRTRRECRD